MCHGPAEINTADQRCQRRESVKKLILPRGTVKVGGVVWLKASAQKDAESLIAQPISDILWKL